jgi:trehalose/maltose transport system substrate-binding protein
VRPSPRALVPVLLCAALAVGCRSHEGDPRGAQRLVLRYQPLGPDPAPFRALVAAFERESGVEVELQALPNAADLAHQLLVTSLGAGGEDVDVLVLDVVWVAELARAGWLADLSDAFPPARVREEFLAGPAGAVVQGGRTYAVPWYVDVGLLYYRTDLVPEPPRTYAALAAAIRAAQAEAPGIAGYLWQGRQYEGLSCNFFEALWGYGGTALDGERLRLDSPAAREALDHLRVLVRDGLSPRSVVTAAEEDARRAFQEGRAVFMRNWPYAWPLLQDPASPVRGRVGVAALPGADGPAPGALGGWQLGISSRAPPARRAAAARLVAHLTSPDANAVLAIAYGRNPARRASYEDPRIRAEAPFIAALLPRVEAARARPVTPYYMLAGDALQGELSAAVSGLRSPAEALARAQAQADAIAGVAR